MGVRFSPPLPILSEMTWKIKFKYKLGDKYETGINWCSYRGIKTGEILPRSEVHKKGLWHRIIVVAIINEKKWNFVTAKKW